MVGSGHMRRMGTVANSSVCECACRVCVLSFEVIKERNIAENSTGVFLVVHLALISTEVVLAHEAIFHFTTTLTMTLTLT